MTPLPLRRGAAMLASLLVAAVAAILPGPAHAADGPVEAYLNVDRTSIVAAPLGDASLTVSTPGCSAGVDPEIWDGDEWRFVPPYIQMEVSNEPCVGEVSKRIDVMPILESFLQKDPLLPGTHRLRFVIRPRTEVWPQAPSPVTSTVEYTGATSAEVVVTIEKEKPTATLEPVFGQATDGTIWIKRGSALDQWAAVDDVVPPVDLVWEFSATGNSYTELERVTFQHVYAATTRWFQNAAANEGYYRVRTLGTAWNEPSVSAPLRVRHLPVVTAVPGRSTELALSEEPLTIDVTISPRMQGTIHVVVPHWRDPTRVSVKVPIDGRAQVQVDRSFLAPLGEFAVDFTSSEGVTVQSAPFVVTFIDVGQPTILGRPKTGATVSVGGLDKWPSGSKLTYQWFHGGPNDRKPIAGATSPTYRLTTDDAGKSLTVLVNGVLPTGTTGAVRSKELLVQPNYGPYRLAGADRFETAVAASGGFGTQPVVYIANGFDFPDALSGAAAAGIEKGSILLTARDFLPYATSLATRNLAPKRIVVLGGTGAVSNDVVAWLRRENPSASVERIAGPDRYATAAAVSRARFAPGVPVAYVASGTAFPDALSGAVAAIADGGPMLLVGENVPGAVATELTRLKPQRIVVLGGPGAVSEGVRSQLTPYAVSGRVDRIAGADRFETSLEISRSVFEPGAGDVYLANGRDFPDALSAASTTGTSPGSVLLVDGRTMTEALCAEIYRLDPRRVTAVGGTSSVSEELLLAAGQCRVK
ncbi:cell wall-binding repeat-containing protein [Microbacterium stercoris]|uniref:Cell wall-binding repeat-containing protein n=1 Tax=Microbacterium stercoris TaxID=2820289 RepID=A0A939QLP8_9MICO|nr:cell wall-binding repeat-containing protein [Microbacterium stercoris]MBO3664989.1 cell wall-binding repeat-containing protein [Microbacterium stercoris]